MAIDVNHFRDIVRTILDAEPSCLLHRGPNQQTPLHRAVLRDDLDTIAILLGTRRELISEKDGYGRTPLHCAAASGAPETVDRLLQEDPSIALLPDHYQATPAHLAAESDRKDSLIKILNACPHSVELLNEHSQNILHVAAQNGSVNVVNYILSLLEADDLINEPDKDGNTPLHLAVMNFHSRVVRDLGRTNEVDIGAINNDGKTALAIAQDYKRNMTTKKSLFKVFQLKEDNFENWRIQMKTLLDSKNLWEVIEKGYQVPEDECNLSQTQRDHIRDARKKDKQALSYIYQAIDENTFEKISRANTAKEAWEILEDSYKTVDKRAMDRSFPDDDDDEEEDKINETQFIIDILKAAYARRARNPKDILDRTTLASKQIKGLKRCKDLWLWYQSQFSEDIGKAAYDAWAKPEDIQHGNKRASEQIKVLKKSKELAGALILMATLIATVTFAAAFTIPGGFKAEDPHRGMVVLGRNVAFRTFIITDTMAMTSSMMAALILIVTPLQTHAEIIERLLLYSLKLLWLALVTMGIAFVTGLYAVLSEQLPLAIVVCCIGCILPAMIYCVPTLIVALQS
ncbi:hypothetical protein PVL29_025596 [Vitis rotundifolia]|uniref:PGG domain-containing protein n=1 Tax=Vitis rotundifolia TaxID=103349 RepID=A0AA38YKB7_VITRO|nr:hypothetical protein PVL29_025596 [Vitis rotundifolia]